MAFSVNGSRRRVFIVAILLSITLITLDMQGVPGLDRVRGVAREAFSPVQGVARSAFRPFENTWNGIRDYGRLKKEYEAARDRADAFEAQSIEAQSQLEELNNLRAEIGLRTCSEIPLVWADVVGRPATNYESSLEISAGSSDGIQTGMPVLTAGGLVGRVGKTSSNRAFVRLIHETDVRVQVQIRSTGDFPKSTSEQLEEGPTTIGGVTTTSSPTTTIATTDPAATDPATNVDEPAADPTAGSLPESVAAALNDPEVRAYFESLTTSTTSAETEADSTPTTVVRAPQSALEYGIMTGNGPGELLSVSLIDGKSQVRVGDPVSTVTNAASLFPGCIPVGKVASVTPRKGSSQVDVKVEPIVDLERINVVTVLRYQPEPGARPVSPTTVAPSAPSTTTSVPVTTAAPASS